MEPRTTRREPFDEWLHRYEPLRGRARMWHKFWRFIGGVIGAIIGLFVLLAFGVFALIIAGICVVLFAGLL